MKQLIFILSASIIFTSCKKDKTPFADVYVAFDYTGAKIDTSTTASDHVIFKNVDGTPAVYVPVSTSSVCDDAVFIGNYPINDTLEWHLRLVEPDGDPANFKLWFNEDHDLILLNESLHFIKPSVYHFSVRTEECNNGVIVVIGN